MTPLLFNGKPLIDTRNDRWKAAEARIAKRHNDPDPEDLRIVQEEQDAWGAANPETGPRSAPEPQGAPKPTQGPQSAS